MDIWCILWTFGIFYGHLVYFVIWFIMLHQEKSGNPDGGSHSDGMGGEEKNFLQLRFIFTTRSTKHT
jgi:hypothetical protein